jgi:hypothetical protein
MVACCISLPSWLDFCYIGSLMNKRRTTWLRKVSWMEFCTALICRTKKERNRNAKTGNLLVCNHALQLPMLLWHHSLSYRYPYMSLENLLWFFLQPWTVGAMFSCIFGLHEFLPSRGVLGAAVVKIIEYFFYGLSFLRLT